MGGGFKSPGRVGVKRKTRKKVWQEEQLETLIDVLYILHILSYLVAIVFPFIASGEG
jgi:competence protein ComGC